MKITQVANIAMNVVATFVFVMLVAVLSIHA
jgi:hypothetical protein